MAPVPHTLPIGGELFISRRTADPDIQHLAQAETQEDILEVRDQMFLQTNTVSHLDISTPLIYPDLINLNLDQVHPLVRNLFPPKIGKFPLGARVKHFARNWTKVSKDPNIRKLVQGWKISLLKKPCQKREPKPLPFSREEQVLIDQEVNEMLRKGVIKPLLPCKNQFVSNLFLTTKKEGTYRPVINLKKLNSSIEYAKFKMEGLKEV